ncbi:hypothetical protein GQ53DRAFT_669908 [Thozetella sp. PMI_491]|nr:hypothetical protein GQ53DRAFT_669908 [Thozetella sp. PMI_491]
MANRGPKACTTCAKAKSRCIPGPDEGKCERCYRLGKSCGSQIPAPPRPRKTPRPTRVAELERRLQDLTSRLESAQVPSLPVAEAAREIMTDMKGHSNGIHPFKHLFPSPSALDTARPTYHAPGWPEGEEAEAFLRLYKTNMTHLFPFAIVPPHMTAAQLRMQKPFFWKAVMMEACHMNGARQMTLGDELLKDIAVASITQPRKSLDLLQGLQVLLAWYHYTLNSFQMTNLLFLCRSICVGLGFTESQNVTKQNEHTSACLERMRAFAGTYYLVTVIFTTNKKPDALMNTSYLEACCRVLESKMEYPTDELLIHLVRAQQLTQSISMALSLRSYAVTAIDIPLSIVVKSFKQQLETFRTSLPPHISENASLRGHLSIAEILLYEIGLSDSSGLTINDQLEFLWACVSATKAFFANRFAGPFSDCPRFICMSTFDLVYAFLTCLKLITFDAPGWDKNLVRQELYFDQMLKRQAEDMEVMAAQRNQRGHLPDKDPLQRLTAKVKCLSQLALAGNEVPKCALLGMTDSPAVEPKEAVECVPEEDHVMLEVGDVTQDIMQDLELVWGDLTGMNDWQAFDEENFANWTLS